MVEMCYSYRGRRRGQQTATYTNVPCHQAGRRNRVLCISCTGPRSKRRCYPHQALCCCNAETATFLGSQERHNDPQAETRCHKCQSRNGNKRVCNNNRKSGIVYPELKLWTMRIGTIVPPTGASVLKQVDPLRDIPHQAQR